MSNEFNEKSGALVLENRKTLKISGVNDVENFEDYSVTIKSELGDLTVSGSDLHINKLDVESGEMILEGKIDSLLYNEPEQKQTGFFSRVFK